MSECDGGELSRPVIPAWSRNEYLETDDYLVMSKEMAKQDNII